MVIPAWRGVLYSATMVALSTLGTGYFIGLFNPAASAAFGVSQGTLSMIFAVSTVAAVGPMFFLGRLVDVFSLRGYTLALMAAFVVAGVVVAWSPHVAVYAVGVFMLRLVGDWLFTHAGLTASARFFGRGRTRLAGMAALGYAIGPSLLPGLALAASEAYGWRTTWLLIAAGVAVIASPALFWLLAPVAVRPPAPSAPASGISGKLVLDRGILAYLPVMMSPALVLSGLLFHQSVWSLSRGGTVEWLSLGLVAYAVSQTAGMFFAGFIAERLSVERALALQTLPAAFGLALGAASEAPWTIVAYLGAGGITHGLNLALTPLMLVARYGADRLGSARAMAQSLTLLSTAFSTIALGLWLDAGMAIAPVFTAGVGFMLLAAVVAMAAGGPGRDQA